MSSYAPRAAAREKLVLQIGKPITIALEYSTGKLVSSSIPGAADQMYYTLTDGRGWYADLQAAELIENLDLVSREPFTVCKVGAGRFEVQRAGEFPTERITTPAQPPVLGQQRTAARLGGERAAEGNNGRVSAAPATAANSHPESTPPAQAQPATKLEQALKTAIAAAANAEKYAKEIGYDCRFNPDAIKSMAISVLIGMEQGARR